jgi:hypothetical protein
MPAGTHKHVCCCFVVCLGTSVAATGTISTPIPSLRGQELRGVQTGLAAALAGARMQLGASS